MKTVPLHGAKALGRVALVDDEDFALVVQYKWYLWEWQRPGRVLLGPYAAAYPRVNGRNPMVRMHKLLTGWPLTDHINHDGLDNRRANLRPATPSQNLHNARPKHGCASRFKGVSLYSSENLWVAAISINRRHHVIGKFLNEEDAARAYDAVAREAFGEYAYLNFP